ncbi:WG repeat-containing protein [Marispirochaeta sp.]|uniref:WG repeat-containing protein n=1 Tax=Marispirochaeta sp. TaxID=2038653 RepID=UPI0029C6A3A1|nr:WG repeat-containing protein [Marispirochaeta sp.]
MKIWKSAYIILVILSCSCSVFPQDDLRRIRFEFESSTGYLDSDLGAVIPAQFDSGTDFVDGIAVVKDEKGYHVINEKGEIVFSTEADYVEKPNNGMILFKMDGVYGFYDYSGKVKLEGYLHAKSFSEDYAIVRTTQKAYYINKNGEDVFPDLAISGGGNFSNGYAVYWVKTNEGIQKGLINNSGEIILPPKFTILGEFSDGLCEASFNDKVGYIDLSGRFIIPPKYNYGFAFNQGIAAVQYRTFEKKQPFYPFWRLINKSGDIVKELSENVVVFSDFIENYAIIGVFDNTREKMLYGYLMKDGETLINPIFDDADVFHDGYAVIEYKGRDALLDKFGTIIYLRDILNPHVTPR